MLKENVSSIMCIFEDSEITEDESYFSERWKNLKCKIFFLSDTPPVEYFIFKPNILLLLEN
jgi:hypothetical protein